MFTQLVRTTSQLVRPLQHWRHHWISAAVKRQVRTFTCASDMQPSAADLSACASGVDKKTKPHNSGNTGSTGSTTSSDDYYSQRRSDLLASVPQYPQDFRPSLSVRAFRAKYDELQPGVSAPESAVERLCGRLTSRRDSGQKLFFMDLTEGGEKVQIMASADAYRGDDFRTWFDLLRPGDIVGVTGLAKRSKRGELSIVPHRLSLLSPCLHPLQGTSTTGARRATHIHLLTDPRSRAVVEAKAKVLAGIRATLDAEGFIEVETPVLSPLAGGAVAEPFVTRHGDGPKAPRLHLRIAPELYLKQCLIGGLERVYEIGRVFRNEGVDATHYPEFTTLEAYMAYADYTDHMRITEQIFHRLALSVAGSDTVGGVSLKPPYARLTVSDALRDLGVDVRDGLDSDVALASMRAVADQRNLHLAGPPTSARLVNLLLGALVEPRLREPTFLMDHPLSLSPLAKEHAQRPGYAARFEMFINGRELVNAYTELNDPREQRRRFALQAQARDAGDRDTMPADEEYCSAMEFGLPPCAGIGIGIDRLVMLLTGTSNIRDVLLFTPLHS